MMDTALTDQVVKMVVFSTHLQVCRGCYSVANEVVYMAIFSTHLQACRGCYRVTVANQVV